MNITAHTRFTPITAAMTAHRRVDLRDSLDQVLHSSAIDAPHALAASLRPRLDSDLREALDALMGIYDARNCDLEEHVAYAERLNATAERLLWEAEAML